MRDPFAPATHADADADGCMSRLAREYPGLGNASPDEARLWVEEFRSRPRALCWRALDAMKRELGSSIIPDLAKFRAACNRLSGNSERTAAEQQREQRQRRHAEWAAESKRDRQWLQHWYADLVTNDPEESTRLHAEAIKVFPARMQSRLRETPPEEHRGVLALMFTFSKPST